MPESPFETAGAQVQPTSAAALHTNEWFTGMWTQGNPLGSGAVPYLYSKFYSASRFDRLIGGQNMEVTAKLTLGRRPGNAVYNPGPFPPINRFFEFRAFISNNELIHVLADCDAPMNQLTNPNFDQGATGWTLGSGWVVGTGSPFNLGLVASYFGPGTAAVANTVHIPATVGTVVSASCESLGEYAASGQANLRLTFYTAGNALIGSYLSPNAHNNYIWELLTVSQAAPATSAYCIVDYVVTGSVSGGPRWFCCQVYGGYDFAVPTVREVTQPSTNTILWDKNSTAGRTGFVSVGNIVYAGDGAATHKWVTSAKTWLPTTLFAGGEFIVDSNNNLQQAIGTQTATIVAIKVDRSAFTIPLPPFTNYWYTVTLYLDPTTTLNIANDTPLTTSGLSVVTWLNGQTFPYSAQSGIQVSYVFLTTSITEPTQAYTAETGSVTTGSGVTGTVAPTWSTTTGGITSDGGLKWKNMGPAVQNFGGDGPTAAPIVSQAPAPSIYPAWAANTWYAPSLIIVDSNGNLQKLTTAGTTGGAAPAWNVTPGGTTADNTAVWTNLGTGAWVNSHVYAAGDVVKATYTYSITVPQQQQVWVTFPTGGGTWQWQTVYVQQQITVTSLFTCTRGGTSGTQIPPWTNGLNTTVTDNTVQWKNSGTPPAWPGAAAVLSLALSVIDSNGNVQVAQKVGESAATAPTWSTTLGATTFDGSQQWLNQGPYSAANSYAWTWAYSGKNSVTGHISTASPLSNRLVVAASNLAVIQGSGLADPQWDTIVLWRTVQNGSILLYDDEFSNPGAGGTWIYTDTNQDPSSVTSPQAGQLNFLITAPIDSSNNPPPAGFRPQVYYLNRIWGYLGNILRWSGGPDTLTGSGNEAFPPLNQTAFPSQGVTCWATSIGLICYTLSDVWVVLGQGTSNSPFYVVNFQQGVGLAGQDAFCVNGSTAYGMLTSGQLVSMDPGAGELEIGFPIGDQFDAFYTGTETYCAWHQGSSADMALYVADGSQGWFRMAPVAAPESGNVWSNRALIQGGVKAIASLETSPGVRRLLLGPAALAGGPILMRDLSTHADNGTAYEAYADIGSIVMAQPGSRVQVQYVVTEEMAIAGSSPAYVGVLFDEISGTFATLRHRTNDPPNLEASETVTTNRWWTSQDSGTIPICRHMQVRIGWLAEDHANELLTYTIYGRLPEKARK